MMAVAGATTAAAASAEPAAESHLPITLDGPVATLAILLGVGGLVAGLLRHRRRLAQEARIQATEQQAPIVPDPAPTNV